MVRQECGDLFLLSSVSSCSPLSVTAESLLCPCPQPWSWDRVDLHGKRDLVDVTKLRTLKSGGYPGLPGSLVSLEGSPQGGDRKFGVRESNVTMEAVIGVIQGHGQEMQVASRSWRKGEPPGETPFDVSPVRLILDFQPPGSVSF